MLSWELEGYSRETEGGTVCWLCTVLKMTYGRFRSPYNALSGRDGDDQITSKYPEFVAYRDVTFYWKYFLVPCDNRYYRVREGTDPHYTAVQARVSWTVDRNNRRADDLTVLGAKMTQSVLADKQVRSVL